MSDIMLVGDAWREKEEEAQAPFVGSEGWILDQLLSQVGIQRRECYLTNVFNLRADDIKQLCGGRTEALPPFPPIISGKYIRNEFAGELARLYSEIAAVRPKIIIALGPVASWALLHAPGIKTIRGSLTTTHWQVTKAIGYEAKVLPTYHPAAINRQWDLRPIILSDLDKAKRHSHDYHYARPERHIWIEPTLEDLAEYDRKFIEPCKLLSADIETRQDQITCIGFSPRPESAIVIPIFLQSGKSYWSHEDELLAWTYIRKWLTTKPTLFQNGLYDINFLWSRYGISVPMASEDTMLLHHAHQPEMEKGLGFLASIYTDEASWKFMSKGTRKHD